VNARSSLLPQSLKKFEINIYGRVVSLLEDVWGKEENGIEKFVKKVKIK